MSGNNLIEEKRGMVFSLDLMLALVIVTVILGVSADAMDMVGSKMEEYSYLDSLQRITMENADILIKTPGSPENWEEKEDLRGISPGLAAINPQNHIVQPNTLSIRKINRLKDNYDELIGGKVIPHGLNSSLMIYPVDSSLEPIPVRNVTPNPNSKEIMVINRTVLCEYSNASIFVFINGLGYIPHPSGEEHLGEKCPHSSLKDNMEHEMVDYINQKSGWICYPFRINKDDLNTTDFYLITDPIILGDPSARWIIDRPENMTEDRRPFNNGPILVNEEISRFLGNESTAVLWVHVLTSGNTNRTFNTYLSGFPRGTPPEKVKSQYINPQPSYFVLKIWV
jgi:hypothetical protein